MGLVAVTLRIMPESPDVDLKRIEKDIENIAKKHGVELKSTAIKPIGFGLSALEILLVVPDSGGTDRIEQDISGIEGVESVEAGDVTLL